MRRGPEALALLGVVVWLALFWRGPLINDVAWQLWIGEQLNGGAGLYRDILEVNPPLWLWLGALVSGAAAMVGIGGLQLLLVVFAATASITLLLCRVLIASGRGRGLTYASLVGTLFLTSPFALGQREQFAWIAVLPYVVLLAARAEGRPVAARLAFAVGLWAAAGLALKHYFMLAPIALEAWLLWRVRTVRLRPELVALALAAAAYAVAILLLAPLYLTRMVPLLALAYGGYDEPLLVQLRQPALFAALFAAVAVVLARGRGPALAQAGGVAAAAFAAVYLLQGKAFHYHSVPALGAGLLAVAALLGAGRWRQLRAPALVAAGLAVAAAVAIPFAAGPARFDEPARAATAGLPRGTPIVMLSASGVAAWPAVQERGLGWASRHMTLWMLPRVWLAERRDEVSPELARLGARVRSEVAAEIACGRPALVLVDRRYDALIGQGGMLGFMSRDPAFRAAMRSYQRAADVGYLVVYRRKRSATGQPAAQRGCDRPQFAI